MFKKDDIVVYTGKYNIFNDLTIGRKYKIIKILPFHGLVIILNDSDCKASYYIKNFISLYEYNILQRKDKIRKIIC